MSGRGKSQRSLELIAAAIKILAQIQPAVCAPSAIACSLSG